MKLKHALPPLAALVASAILLSAQRQELAGLRTEIRQLTDVHAALREEPALLPGTSGAVSETRIPKPHSSATVDTSTVSVEDLLLAATCSASANRGENMKAMMVEQKVKALNAEQLLALFAAVSESSLADRDKQAMTIVLGRALTPKVPAAATQMLLPLWEQSEATRNSSRESLSWAFLEWAEADPAAAAAWFDGQREAGLLANHSLDEPDKLGTMFEGLLLPGLLIQDSTAAEARMAALPPADRGSHLARSGGFPVSRDAQMAVAGMAGRLLDGEAFTEVISNYAGVISKKASLEEVSWFMSQLEIPSEGRAQIVQNALSARAGLVEVPTVENLSEWRTWAEQTSPESAGRMVAASLAAHLNDKFSLTDAAVILTKTEPADQRDLAIAALVQGIGSGVDRTAAVTVATTIRDEALRAAVLAGLPASQQTK